MYGIVFFWSDIITRNISLEMVLPGFSVLSPSIVSSLTLVSRGLGYWRWGHWPFAVERTILAPSG